MHLICQHINVTGSVKPSMFACFTQDHRNASNLITDASIDTCFTGNIMWSFSIYCAKYSVVIGSHYKLQSCIPLNSPKFPR